MCRGPKSRELTDLVKDGVDDVQVDDGEYGAVEEEEGGQRPVPRARRCSDLKRRECVGRSQALVLSPGDDSDAAI